MVARSFRLHLLSRHTLKSGPYQFLEKAFLRRNVKSSPKAKESIGSLLQVIFLIF